MLSLINIKGIMIDIDGTLMRGNKILPGVKEFLETIDIPILIVSNNSKSPKRYIDIFNKNNIKLKESQILTTTITTKKYLENHPEIKSAYVIGKPDLIKAISETRVKIINTFQDEVADAVIVGGDFNLNYEKLKNAVLHLQGGSILIGSNGDMLIPTEEGLVPEAGMTLAALTAGSGVKPIILGKPYKYFFDIAIDILGVNRENVVMLGDRLDTDILGASDYGLKTILVMTGVDDELEVKKKGIYPDLIVDDLIELKKIWTRRNRDEK
ncbi:MAG: HAD-IIA family hydrolase [Firmicutes bacterium]|nr:HAD-IIA family hydrolase [Bacillota bacterium]